MRGVSRPSYGTARSETIATAIPVITSRTKWLAVARTQNHTQTGHRAQRVFTHQRRETATRTTQTMSASAAWRLGMAAYGFAKVAREPSEWLTPSSKYVANIQG